jgi:hypothetical protein
LRVRGIEGVRGIWERGIEGVRGIWERGNEGVRRRERKSVSKERAPSRLGARILRSG